MNEEPSRARKKWIKTLAQKEWISKRKAEQKQAIAIAYSKAWKSESKKK